MKFKTIALSLAFGALLAASPAISAKTGILVAHYGSSDPDTRAHTIDRITRDIREAFPHATVAEAYISAAVLRSMRAKGLSPQDPAEALADLAEQGCDTVLVQSTTLIDGSEMAEVRNSALEAMPLFKCLRLGRSLCFSPDDCLQVVDILAQTAPAQGEAVVFVGHGNMLPSTATYAQLDYMLHAAGHPNIHVSTIEGYPTVGSLITELQANPDIKSVRLVPLLLVCGNHTRHDIAGEFASALRNAGYHTHVQMTGLAENPAIRRLYVDRVKALAVDDAQ